MDAEMIVVKLYVELIINIIVYVYTYIHIFRNRQAFIKSEVKWI